MALIVISPILLVITIWLHFANKGAGKENILEKFQDAFHEHAFEKIIELGGKVAKNAVLHKLGLA